MARGSRTEKGRELPESRTSSFARKVIETYLTDGLDQIEDSLEDAGQDRGMSLILASVLLQDEGVDCDVWDHWLRVEYLEAVREAVAQSLEALNASPTACPRTSRTRH